MNDFNKWTVRALRDYCKEHHIKIPAKSKKADIIELIENTPIISEEIKTFTDQRQKIIEKVLTICRKEGEKKILDYFQRRNESSRYKNTFEVFKLNLKNPTIKEIRICLKYYQETQDYDEEEKLLINQMITQPKFINPDYIDPRMKEHEILKQQFEFRSATGSVPQSEIPKKESLNKPKTI